MLLKPLSKRYKQEFKTRPSCLSNTLTLEDQDTFLYFLCSRLIPRVYIDAQSFWKLAKQCDNKIKPDQKNDNDLTLWYCNVFDFSKIGYKTLEILNSRSKKFTYVCLHGFSVGLNKCCHCRNVIATDGYAISFMFKKTVSIQDEPKRESKTPKDSADIVDDAEIWAVDSDISTIFTAVDSTEHGRIRTTNLE